MTQVLQVLAMALALGVLPGVAAAADVPSQTDRPVVPVTARPEPRPAALPPGTVNGFQLVRGKVSTMSAQVKMLEAGLNQPTWNAAVQTQVSSWRGVVAGMQQDAAKLVAANRSPNMNVGLQVSSTLQGRVNELGQAVDGLAQARDTSAARGALTKISASLGTIMKTMEVNQQCCEALTCCAIGIK